MTHYETWNLVITGIGVSIAVGVLVIYFLQLKHMRESSERQLRAYVTCELGTIINVANPVPIFPGQQFTPNAAWVTNPAAGPGALLQIKNTGQTPAFHVRHWGNICLREYPLIAGLPARLPNIIPTACVLGPGCISTKLFQLNPALTAQETDNLRAGTGAVYVYGEITYADTFGHERITQYRLMHHAMGGAIGVATSLNFTDEGNEAT